ncbi:MAG: sigma-70 family RNA polymerase sigma factor [Solirubrobacterales bacterium]|nr:sigma-70 family RNA polymerase sigma factor [Solirubrobacterales bacterium]
MVARAYGKALTEDEVEDIYSAAWAASLSALRNRGDEMSEPELRAYVLTAVASHASKEMRRRNRKPTAPLEDAQQESVADRNQLGPEELVIGSEARGVARDLLASLPARRRAVMFLRYGWGLSPTEVCALVSGLSRRAYRKEVTRGVEELIDRLRQVESGEWCRSREPMLRDYIAGIADEETRRQIEQHFSHCRACSDLATALRVELNDLGGVIAIGATAGLIAGVHVSAADKLTSLIQGGRDAAAAVVERTEVSVGSAVASGGVRGPGAAGAGVAAKLASVGGAGKAALACLGAGAAATACVAAGVVPGVTLSDVGLGGQSEPKAVRVQQPDRSLRDVRPDRTGRSTPASANPTASPPDSPTPSPDPETGGAPEEGTSVPPTPAQEFDPVAVPPTPTQSVGSGATDSSGVPEPGPTSTGSSGGGSIAGEEFGP